MSPIVFFGIVLVICALILGVSACMRSSQISQEEEFWVLDRDQQWRLVTKPEEEDNAQD